MAAGRRRRAPWLPASLLILGAVFAAACLPDLDRYVLVVEEDLARPRDLSDPLPDLSVSEVDLSIADPGFDASVSGDLAFARDEPEPDES